MSSQEKSRPPLPEWLFSDSIALALLTLIIGRRRENSQTYAASYVLNDEIIGLGRNMKISKEEPWLVKQGYANHAEMMAYSVAALNSPGLVGGIIYVIGLLPENRLFIHKPRTELGENNQGERFTCIRCAKKMCEHQIKGVLVPNTIGWHFLSAEDALASAEQFKRTTLNNGVGRNEETILYSDESTQKLLSLVAKTPPDKIIANLMRDYRVSPLVSSLLRLAAEGGGYIDKTTFNRAVLRV